MCLGRMGSASCWIKTPLRGKMDILVEPYPSTRPEPEEKEREGLWNFHPAAAISELFSLAPPFCMTPFRFPTDWVPYS
ncbi:hypothetical protein TorRG33x02_015590 [Trema orientale]|uniref:Uncharacterized protein n=1 Tax=Trema orientale TaxID=63057 RepID=A0A2P5FXR6_TREOI|nr:hypothetical protein TorRG33x02_015590 [Trema orientale]